MVPSATLEAARLAPRGGGGAPSGRASPRECHAAWRRLARPEEAQGASLGTVKEGTLAMLARLKSTALRERSRRRVPGLDFGCVAHTMVVSSSSVAGVSWYSSPEYASP